MGVRTVAALLLLLVEVASGFTAAPVKQKRRAALPATAAAVHDSKKAVGGRATTAVAVEAEGAAQKKAALEAHLAQFAERLASTAVSDFESLAVELTATAEVLRATAKDVTSKNKELHAYRASLAQTKGQGTTRRPKKKFDHTLHSFGGAVNSSAAAPILYPGEADTVTEAQAVTDAVSIGDDTPVGPPELPPPPPPPVPRLRRAAVAAAPPPEVHHGFAAESRSEEEEAQEAQETEEAEHSAQEASSHFEPIKVVPGRNVEPFGTEDTAHELQDAASETQDTLVDAIEAAQIAEIKRSIFRALTRLRAATVKEYDTIARLETQAIDAYNDAHNYRAENPLRHLHTDESPVVQDKLKSFH